MASVSYKIDTEIPLSYTEKLLDFIQRKFLLPQKERFTGISRKRSETGSYLSYAVRDQTGQSFLQVEVKASKPLDVNITPIDQQVPEAEIEKAKQDIVIALQIFEENARKSTLYFA